MQPDASFQNDLGATNHAGSKAKKESPAVQPVRPGVEKGGGVQSMEFGAA